MIWKKKSIKKSPSEKHSKIIWGGAGAIVVSLAALVTMALLHRHSQHQQAGQLADQAAQGPLVEIAEAQKSPQFREIEVIGEARAFLTDNVYARASGYVREVRFDKGDRVVKDQILAVVESPETDRAYLAALADYGNKKRIADRMKLLLKRKLVAPQDAEAAFANSDIAKATLDTQEVLKSYEQVRAPFDGVVTSRLVDPGNLIQNASNSQSAQQLLATLSQTDTLRIYAFVDQKDATFIKIGDAASIQIDERPDYNRQAQVSRTAGELDPKTRKMLTEIDVPNVDKPIVPGSFVRVRIKLEAPSYPSLPVKALVVRDKKTFVPLLAQDNTIHYKPIEVLDNDGETLRITSGINPGERVALDLGNSVTDGAHVRPRPMAGEMYQTPAYPGAGAPTK